MTIQKLAMFSRGHIASLLHKLIVRQLSLSTLRSEQQALNHLDDVKEDCRSDEEWVNAKDYDTIPGPTRIGLLMDFLPGGKLNNSNLVDMNSKLRDIYGDVFRLKGMLGKPDTVFTYNPVDFEVTFRNEGVWPIRVGLYSFDYYRKEKRPDVFQGVGGLVSDQGKGWADVRNKVNPILMKVQTVRQNLPEIDQIATEFLTRLDSLLDPNTNQLKTNFHDEIKMWSFESIAYIALNTRIGLFSGKADQNARKLANNMSDFFEYAFKYDVAPTFWKYIETPGFKRLIQTYDSITDITINYIEAAMSKFKAEKNKEAKSVLEKLCRIDKKVAIVMAMDMLMAGMDTTSSTFITTLYLIAKHPEKQDALRRELETIMPNSDTPLTNQNTKNMPYLRACIKESLRITPITPGNFRMSIRDLVLSGYKVPKGTGVLMNGMALANTEEYFPRSAEFLPERWLKSGESACPMAKNTIPFVYLPFGFGPRTCVGKRIAEMEMETLLAKLLRKYKVTWEDKDNMKYITNIILVPSGNMKFKFEPLK